MCIKITAIKLLPNSEVKERKKNALLVLCVSWKGKREKKFKKKHSVRVTGEQKDSGFELWNDTWVNGKLLPKNRRIQSWSGKKKGSSVRNGFLMNPESRKGACSI